MNDRTHTALRLGAIALLVGMCVWPRSRGRDDLRLAREASSLASGARAATPRVETTRTKLAASPRMVKLVVAEADETRLTN